MRVLKTLCITALASGLMMAQSSAPTSGSDASSIANEVKKLQEAMTAQQKAMTDQQQKIADQQAEIEKLKQQLNGQPQAVSSSTDSQTPKVVNATLTAPKPAVATASDMQEDKPKESPLSFRIGGAEFTPGGFVDFENVFRSTNTGNAAATNFGAIPFSNTVQGHLTEYRATGQYSRLSMKVTSKFGANNVTGYVEGDFNGNDAANVFVGTNPHTARLRLYWVDLKRGKWEFLGGQAWGLLTPNRTGLSPNPSDLALTYGEDANVHVGINHTRAGTFRAVWHPTDDIAWGFGIENPQQFVGAGEVIFPFAFNAQLGPQFDAANNPGTPNVAPDFNTKLALDKNLAGRHFHWEVGGMMTTVKATILPIGGTGFNSHSKVGGGIQSALNFEFVKNVRFVTNVLYGNGVGRYMIGLGPQTVIRPVATATGFDATPSLVHATNGTVGLEVQPRSTDQFGLYYGGAYFQRNAFLDITNPVPGRIAGFGGVNSPNSANRAIQQGTLDWTHTFWKNPQYGAVLLVTQYSYLTRAPWFVALGAPKNAHLSMGYASVRYVLP